MTNFVGAIDQGTSSSRFLIFESNTGRLVTYHQTEIPRFAPQQGLVEQDAKILISSTLTCIDQCVEKFEALGFSVSQIKSVGITNQRETFIAWDKITGRPLYNAIVWMDTRSRPAVEEFLSTKKEECEKIRRMCGLPMSTYFSALKMKWLLDNVPEVRNASDENRLLFGTVDSWLVWNLTGGISGGLHITDVTNASRTMLMNLETLQWDPYLCEFFGIDVQLLPEIRSSSEIYGHFVTTKLAKIPISGILGDQQAALVGQSCLRPGEAKCTYGTGCFLLFNTGEKIVHSTQGLLTTVGYKLGQDSPVVYAMEGSIAITGACIRWLRDNLGFGKNYGELVQLADSVDNTGGVFFVPAFSGLFAPYWKSGARGLICGLTEFSTKAHITRAAYEGVAFQVKDILDAINNEAGVVPLCSLRVDGGMTVVDSLMRMQADFLGIETLRAKMPETTALGAAMAAGFAKGVDVWNPFLEQEDAIGVDVFRPTMDQKERDERHAKWKNAVARSW
ncbi:glycerol kinase [Folsomia candida]|uniref:glycerol kinase n=1 Tax=Folsomia candida TaxID=158441 RepID=UPI000B8F212A|nr:glycerol kinase [Folsomia candida]XP_021961798.1 glycerol kinase [Folsomia candida]